MEQFDYDFVKNVNPKSEIPVVKIGDKIVPDSSTIIQTLEDTFKEGYPNLTPSDKGHHFEQLYNSLEIRTLTFGAMHNVELTTNREIPDEPRLNYLTKIATKRPAILKAQAEAHPDVAEIYNEKLQQTVNFKVDKARLECELVKLEVILEETEQHLLQMDEKSWLCGNNITLADIYLALLMRRLVYVGLAYRYWGNGKRPNLSAYYQRWSEKKSFKEVFYPTSA